MFDLACQLPHESFHAVLWPQVDGQVAHALGRGVAAVAGGRHSCECSGLWVRHNSHRVAPATAGAAAECCAVLNWQVAGQPWSVGGGEGDVAASAKIAASAPALQVCGNCHDVEDRGVVAGHRHNEELQSSSTAQETAAKQKSEACRSARHNHEFFW